MQKVADFIIGTIYFLISATAFVVGFASMAMIVAGIMLLVDPTASWSESINIFHVESYQWIITLCFGAVGLFAMRKIVFISNPYAPKWFVRWAEKPSWPSE